MLYFISGTFQTGWHRNDEGLGKSGKLQKHVSTCKQGHWLQRIVSWLVVKGAFSERQGSTLGESQDFIQRHHYMGSGTLRKTNVGNIVCLACHESC